jgi:hypothetical protein
MNRKANEIWKIATNAFGKFVYRSVVRVSTFVYDQLARLSRLVMTVWTPLSYHVIRGKLVVAYLLHAAHVHEDWKFVVQFFLWSSTRASVFIDLRRGSHLLRKKHIILFLYRGPAWDATDRNRDTKFSRDLSALTDTFRVAKTTSSLMKIAVFWVVAPCSLVEVYQRFRSLLPPSSGRTPWEPAVRTSNPTSSLILYPVEHSQSTNCLIWMQCGNIVCFSVHVHVFCLRNNSTELHEI